MIFETENLEFKLGFTEEIYKEVIAFANSNGGVIYIGIDDEGNAVGIENVDDEYLRITNGIRDAIAPDVTMFVRYTIQDNRVIKITVTEGTKKPYYLKAKGFNPSGVYIRQGASKAQASIEQIRQLIKISDGDIFEEARAKKQSLTFECAKKTFERYGVEFSEDKFLPLNLVNPNDKLYNNLAFILSDQCEHTVKVAVFADDDMTLFKDAKEFGGSIFKQLDDTFEYLLFCNKTAFDFKGLERIERPDYSEVAIREALLNALVHREYSFSGSIIINISDNKIEFISLGGLMPGMSTDDVLSGISLARNKSLAEIFHRLKLIEAYGTGIRKIFKEYEGQRSQPEIIVTPNTFKIILPNMNTLWLNDIIVDRQRKAEMNSARNFQRQPQVTPQQAQVLEYIKEHGQVTDDELKELLGIKTTRVYVLAKQMRDTGLIRVIGRGANKKYVL